MSRVQYPHHKPHSLNPAISIVSLRRPPSPASAHTGRMLASQLSSRATRPAPFTAAVKPQIAVSRRVLPVVCSATQDAPVVVEATPQGPKDGVAHLNFQRGSPFKVRRILDVIRGRPYEEALMILEYLPHRACESILKTLTSAAANAKNNKGASKARLYVKECFADGGPQLKRARPRAQGRAYKIMKPTYHMTIKVEEKQ